MYDLEETHLIEEIRNRSARRVLLQFPEGLKSSASILAERLGQKTGAEVFVSGDSCYGACDLALLQMQQLQADLLIHIGHAEIPGQKATNVLYVEARSDEKIEKPLEDALKLLKQEKKVGLVACVQHLNLLEAAKDMLERAGKVVVVGKPSGWLTYEGQVLGCDHGGFSAASDIDAFLVVAGGDFHTVGVSITSDKKTVVADPYQQTARDVTSLVRKILRQRYATILRFKETKRVGIVAGLKSGQMNLALARRLKILLEENGKICTLIAALELVPASLESFTDLDGFVEIACPRISIDDRGRYQKPILNPEEVLIAIGDKSWEEYVGYPKET